MENYTHNQYKPITFRLYSVSAEYLPNQFCYKTLIFYYNYIKKMEIGDKQILILV